MSDTKMIDETPRERQERVIERLIEQGVTEEEHMSVWQLIDDIGFRKLLFALTAIARTDLEEWIAVDLEKLIDKVEKRFHELQAMEKTDRTFQAQLTKVNSIIPRLIQ